MARSILLLFLALVGAFAQTDPTRIRWTTAVSEPLLLPHQRFAVQVAMVLDGRDIAKRRGQGSVRMSVRITDSSGRAWRNGNAIDLTKVGESIKANDVEYIQQFFVLPGDYEILCAIHDTESGARSTMKKKLHVAALRNDPLPDAWRDLPAVEFIPSAQEPDLWYMPQIDGKLNLPAVTRRPSTIDLLVNLTPSERLSGSTSVQNQVFATLIPTLKVLSQVHWSNASMNISLLDLSRRRVTFQQNNAHGLDWAGAGPALADAKPGIIDAKSLEDRKYSAAFFVKEVSRRVSAPDDGRRHIVIVLSRPVIFEPGVELNPIDAAPPAAATVFYFRYQPPQAVLVAGGRGIRGSLGPQRDQLEPLLKGVNPRLFDVATPEQFRRAFAAMLDQIARL